MRITVQAVINGTIDDMGAIATAYRAIQQQYGLETPSNPIVPIVSPAVNEVTKFHLRFRKSGVAPNQLQANYNVWLAILAAYAGAPWNMVERETLIEPV